METHIIPDEYNGPHLIRHDILGGTNYYIIEAQFATLALAEEWLKQRKLSDELAIELEEYNG